MRFAIYGTGAVGAVLGVRLLEVGHEVHFIARGAHLARIQEHGLRVRSKVFGDKLYEVNACSDPSDIGPVDYVILGVKASSLSAIAPSTEALKSPRTTFVSTQNGLPWWYFHGIPGNDAPIRSVDPDGLISRHIPPSSVVGAIVYFSSSIESPGVIGHSAGIRLPIGEPAGGRSERVLALAEAMRKGGIKAPVRGDIRHELWVKLLGNGALNPLSAVTRLPLGRLIDAPLGRSLALSMMEEIRQVAEAMGARVPLSNERRLEGARGAGYHETSMLQDLKRGREPELDALLGSVIELAEANHVAVPTLRAISAATRLCFESARLGRT